MELAAQVSRLKDDHRTYFLGAVGLRKDGVIVASANGNPVAPEPKHHAEARVLRKMGKGGILFVVRTLADGTWGNARPCKDCMPLIKNHGISRVYFSSGIVLTPGISVCTWENL
jgi:tRNA(Arg) A34 adenosine deaminase TadA